MDKKTLILHSENTAELDENGNKYSHVVASSIMGEFGFRNIVVWKITFAFVPLFSHITVPFYISRAHEMIFSGALIRFVHLRFHM